MPHFLGSLCFTAPGLLAVVIVLTARNGVITRASCVGCLAAIYLLAGVLIFFGADSRVFDIEACGLRFSLPKNSGRTLTIGGERNRDDIYVPNYPAGAFALDASPSVPATATASKDQGGTVALRRTQPARGENAAVTDSASEAVSREVVRLGSRYLGVHPLQDHARITWSRPGESVQDLEFFQPASHFLTFAKLESAAGKWELRTRRIEVPFISWQIPLPVLPERRVELLVDEDVAPNPNTASGQPMARLANPLRLPVVNTALVYGDFTSNNVLIGSKFNQVNVILQDADVVMQPPGGAAPVRWAWDQSVPVPPGQSLTFARITHGPLRKIQPALSFDSVKVKHALGEHWLEMRFAKPLPYQISLPTAQDTLVLQSSLLARAEEKLVRFESLSSQTGFPGARLNLEPRQFTLRSPWRAESGLAYGSEVWVGESNALILKVSRQSPPWSLLGALGLACLMTICGGHSRLTDRGMFALLAGSAILCCARAVCAFPAEARFPFERGAMGSAIYTLLLVPAVILVIGRTVDFLERGGQTVQSTGNSTWLASNFSPRALHALQSVGIVFVAAAAPVVAGRGLSTGKAVALYLPLVVLAGFALWPAWSSRAQERWNLLRRKIDSAQGYRSLWRVGVVLYGVRLVMLIGGFKERINLGAPVPLALLYVPAYLLLFALGCARFWHETANKSANAARIRQFVAFAAGLTGMHILCCVLLVSDIGMGLYVLPVWLMVAAVVLHSLPRAHLTLKTAAWASVTVLPLLAGAIFFLAPQVPIRIAEFFVEREILSEKLRDPEAVITNKLTLRLLQWVSRTKLAQNGTVDSEEIAQHLEIMDDYTSRGFWGVGYMKVPVVPAVREMSVSDNVAAVYILAQFGVVGTAGLCMAWCLLATVAARRLPDDPDENDPYPVWRRFGWCLGALAGVTLAFVSLYMLAANCELALFTGRNIYLLGINSLGDVWESCVLLAFCAAGLQISQPATTTP